MTVKALKMSAEGQIFFTIMKIQVLRKQLVGIINVQTQEQFSQKSLQSRFPVKPIERGKILIIGTAKRIPGTKKNCQNFDIRSEPTRAQSKEGFSPLAESSRVFFGTVILNSDWLTTRVT